MTLAARMAMVAVALFFPLPALSQTTDDSFLRQAIEINLAEIAAGNLAQTKGTTAAVKAYGKLLVRDHSVAEQAAVQLARKHDMQPPAKAARNDRNLLQHLGKLKGIAFDRAFAAAMINGHQQAIHLFEQETLGRDDDFSNLAQQSLPVLQDHLTRAQNIASALNATNSPAAAQ